MIKKKEKLKKKNGDVKNKVTAGRGSDMFLR